MSERSIEEMTDNEVIAYQQRALLERFVDIESAIREIRDDIRVLTAIAMREDNRSLRMLELLHSTIDRVRALEDTQP